MEYIARNNSENQIINAPDLGNSKINFMGKNNILFFEKNSVKLDNSVINFKGDNSVIIIKDSRDVLKLNLTIYSGSIIYLGNNCSMNNKLEIIASEGKNVVIGDEGLFSSQCLIRTSDAHRIYSIETLKRINEGRSVYIGDHVWLAARVVILKGTRIHSGSVIGSDAVVAGKEILSNSIWAGNPAKEIKNNILFDKAGTHGLTAATMAEVNTISTSKASDYIFKYDSSVYMDFKIFDDEVSALSDPNDKLAFVLKKFENGNRNRFALV